MSIVELTQKLQYVKVKYDSAHFLVSEKLPGNEVSSAVTSRVFPESWRGLCDYQDFVNLSIINLIIRII